MKKFILIAVMILFAVAYVSAQVDLRPKLKYSFAASNGFPVTTNKAWINDTMALRALLDSKILKSQKNLEMILLKIFHEINYKPCI